MKIKIILTVAEILAFIGSLFADDFPVTEQLQPAFVVTEQHNGGPAQQEPERNERVLFFTASWCNPCKRAKAEFVPWLVQSGWVVSDSPSAHVQVVDADDNPQMIAEYGITMLPTFVLVNNRKELRRAGYSDRATVVNLWFGNRQTAATQQPVAVASAGDEAAPTPYHEIVRVLALLPKPETAFVEYGCGNDARWCVAAVERWGCKAVGIEIDPIRARAAQEHVHKIGLSRFITIIEGDAIQVDVEGDIGAAYLYAETLEALRPRIEKLKAFASYQHRPPGLHVTKSGDSWLYVKPTYGSTQGAVWNGYIYQNPVCDSPTCRMCNSIRAQLSGSR